MYDPITGSTDRISLHRRGHPHMSAQPEQPVGEGPSNGGQDPGDLHWSGAFQIARETARVGRSLRRMDAHEDPCAGRSATGFAGCRPMPTQTAIEPGPRDLRVEEFPRYGGQIVERQEQCPAQRNRAGLLRRRRRGLQRSGALSRLRLSDSFWKFRRAPAPATPGPRSPEWRPGLKKWNPAGIARFR